MNGGRHYSSTFAVKSGRSARILSLFAALLLFAAAPVGAAGFRPRTFGYVLQADGLGDREAAVAALADSERDLLILDGAYVQGAGGRWTAAELASIRRAWPGRKLLAYLSIGEAEEYRDYWRKDWRLRADGKPGARTPAFIVAANPVWKGNFLVRYWRPAWQRIVLAELDRLVAQGFDGVYLDIVDAFEAFEYDPTKKRWIDGRINPETGHRYRADMIAWVRRIARRARGQRPGFMIFPQNGTQLLRDAAYRDLIDGVGVESLYLDGDSPRAADYTRAVLKDLARLRGARKTVLLIEYPRSLKAKRYAARRARKDCYPLLLTTRNLDDSGASLPASGCR